MTHLLTPQVINALANAKNLQEIMDTLTPTDYGRSLREQEQINAFTLEGIFKRKLMERCEHLLKTAPEEVVEFLLGYYRKFEIQNISRVLRSKISRAPIQPFEYALFPNERFSTVDIEGMTEASDAEEFIASLRKTHYSDVVNSLEWYRKYDSFLPIEFHLKKIYFGMLFQDLKRIPIDDREKVGRLIRTEVDIANCFTSIAASLYGYDKELIESLLIPFPLKLSLKTLRSVIERENPPEILDLLSPYSEVAKQLLLFKDEIAAQTEAFRLLRDEVIRNKTNAILDFTYVMSYLFLCEFECRDLTFIAVSLQYNIKPENYLICKG